MTLLTPKLGEPVEPTSGVETARWWRDYPPMTKVCPDGTKVATKKTIDDWPL